MTMKSSENDQMFFFYCLLQPFICKIPLNQLIKKLWPYAGYQLINAFMYFAREPDSGVLQEGGMLLVGLANGKVAMFPVLELLHVCIYCKLLHVC